MIREYTWHNKPCIEFTTAQGQLQISLWGGHLLQWQPKMSTPVFWLSDVPPQAEKPIRGGIPVCWPWFGTKEGYENHGWVRTSLWKLDNQEASGLTLGLTGTLKHIPGDYQFRLQQQFILSDSLTQTLTFQHNCPDPVMFQTALHSYFAVSHPEHVIITGLESKSYEDKLENYQRKQTPTKIDANLPWDATIANNGNWTLEDTVLGRRIRCNAQGADTTVLWHPSDETTQRMPDIHPGGNSEYLCLETASLNSNAIPAGQEVKISHTLRIETI